MQANEHDVVTARFQFCCLSCRNPNGFYRPHFQHVVFSDVRMQFDNFGYGTLSSDEGSVTAAVVCKVQVGRGVFDNRRHGADVFIRYGEISCHAQRVAGTQNQDG